MDSADSGQNKPLLLAEQTSSRNLVAYYNKNKTENEGNWGNIAASKHNIKRCSIQKETTNENSATNMSAAESTVDCVSSMHRGHCYLTANDVLGLMHVPPKHESSTTKSGPLINSHGLDEDMLSLGSSQPSFPDDYRYASLRNETSV